jgi:hypothetical protein
MYGPNIVLLTKIKPEYSDNLYNPTHFPGPLVCRIGQIPLYMLFWAMSLLGIWCFTPLSTIFQLCHGCQFYWWRKRSTRRNHRSAASHWQTLSHNVASSTPRLNGIRTHNVSGDRHWLHIGSCKSNYHTTTMTTMFSLHVLTPMQMITAHNYFHQAITDILQQNRFLTYEINKALPWKYKIQNTKIKHHELLRLLANFTLDLRLISTLKFLSQIHVMWN